MDSQQKRKIQKNINNLQSKNSTKKTLSKIFKLKKVQQQKYVMFNDEKIIVITLKKYLKKDHLNYHSYL